jgi:hypothetical protein
MELAKNVDILSQFVKTIAVEHADDVIDPQGFLKMFGIDRDDAKGN